MKDGLEDGIGKLLPVPGENSKSTPRLTDAEGSLILAAMAAFVESEADATTNSERQRRRKETALRLRHDAERRIANHGGV